MPPFRPLSPALLRQIGRFGPAMGRRRWPDILRAAAGAGLGILIVTLIVAMQPRSQEAQIYLVSSFASTAVLLFVLPNSPLAQPWSALVGMMVSAAVPVAVLALVPPPWADGLAVTSAIIAMMALRALHPPAAGLALLAVLEFESDHPLGLGFAIFPVGVLTLVLVVVAMLWNRMFGIAYPARPAAPAQGPAQGPGGPRPGRRLSQQDLAQLLLEFNQSAIMAPSDLAALMEVAEARAARALLAGTPIEELMARAPVTVSPEAPMAEMLRKLAPIGLHALVVCDSEGQYLGLVDQDKVMLHLAADLDALRHPLRRFAPPPEIEARNLMDATVAPVAPGLAIGAVLERLSQAETPIVPVTLRGRLVGTLARADLVAFLLDHSPAAPEIDAEIEAGTEAGAELGAEAEDKDEDGATAAAPEDKPETGAPPPERTDDRSPA